MTKHEVLNNLLKSCLLSRLEKLENNYNNYDITIDECILSVNSISDQKLEIKISIINNNSEIHTISYPNRRKQYILNDSTLSTKINETNDKNQKRPFLTTNKSLKEMNLNDNKSEKNILRSSTKAIFSKSKEKKEMKRIPQTSESIINIKIEKINKNHMKPFLKPNPVIRKTNLNQTFHHTSNKNKIITPEKTNKIVKSKNSKKVLSSQENNNYVENKNSKKVSNFRSEEIKEKNSLLKSEFSPKINSQTPIILANSKQRKFSTITNDSLNKLDKQLSNEIDNLKNTEKTIKIEYFNELMKNNFSNIAKFLDKNDFLNLKLNKAFSKLTIKSLISLKKDEMIQNEKNIKILREKYSMDDLMKEPDEFKISDTTKKILDSFDDSFLGTTLSEKPPEHKIMILFRCFFQAININFRKSSEIDFWADCRNYFKDKNIREIINNSIKTLDFSDINILKISKIINNGKTLDLILYRANPFTELIALFMKDILDYIGIYGDNSNNACILFSLYRYIFENINNSIEKLKRMENTTRKN